jgi:hypothetical protein
MGMSSLARRTWRSMLASATVVAALSAFTAQTATAQDVPWGKGSTKQKSNSNKTSQAPPKAPAATKQPAAPKAPAAPNAPTAPKIGKAPAATPPPIDAKGAGDDARARMGAQPFPGDVQAKPRDARSSKAGAPRVAKDAADLDALRAALEPFGTWIDDPERGTLWIPDQKEVGKDFAPYKSGGRWGFDKSGDWTWISDYAWGDIPFHFGNWTWLPPADNAAVLPAGLPGGLPAGPQNKGPQSKTPQAPLPQGTLQGPSGWAWVPGFDYAPAWVVWRLGESVKDPFVGWAPMPPSQRLMNGKLEPFASEQVLPFFYVRADKLFDGAVARHVVADRKLGRAVHDTTKIFGGSVGACAPGRVKDDKAKQRCQNQPAQLWRAASPTLKQAGIAAALISEPPQQPRKLNDALRALSSGSDSKSEKRIDNKQSKPEKVERLPPAAKSPRSVTGADPKGSASRLDDDGDDGSTTVRGKNFVRRCVRTQRHGMRCWTYRWPPLWRGRR